MRLLLTGSVNPYVNLSTEEYFFRNSDDDIFMLWRNEPTVVIGKNQNMYAEVDTEYTEAHGIHIARRITGGGAVYHDLENINYTFITSREKAAVLDYAYFTRPIVEALREMGLNVYLSGRNDLLVKVGTEEFKFSGNAETASETRILHHGTILFNSDLSVLSRTLKPDEDKLRRKGIPSVRSRVTNLKPLLKEETDVHHFFSQLVSFIERTECCKAETVDLSPILQSAAYLRHQDPNYQAGRKISYAHRKKIFMDTGIVWLLWNTAMPERMTQEACCENEFENISCITDFYIEGDFFGKKDAEELISRFSGVSLTKEALTEALGTIDVGEYIFGLTNKDLTEALLSCAC